MCVYIYMLHERIKKILSTKGIDQKKGNTAAEWRNMVVERIDMVGHKKKT